MAGAAGQAGARVSCDSLVALPGATADGAVWFAKNSDRPADEAQPLVLIPRQSHPRGAAVRCQYLEIPQVPETARMIGSQPFWLWGFEHGLNEHGVAIGNHSVFTRDPLEGTGLLGMDLVRLGLERGRTAAEARDAIAALVERYGQGGSGYVDKDWAYHNSFLIADRAEAFLLETSDRRWAARRVRDIGSVSNHLTIGTDWDALGPGTVDHAVDRGWWRAGAGARFDFAAAYRDVSVAPEIISSGRYGRTCALLGAAQGRVRMADLRAALRDHYESGPVYQPRHAPDDERYYGVCMHADPVGTTTASMIARLPAGDDEPLVYWAGLGSPCLGVFLPCYIDAGIPEILARGGGRPTLDSPWWRFKELLTRVERDWLRHAPDVRRRWDAFESRVIEEAAHVEAAATAARRSGDRAGAAAALAEFTRRTVAAALAELERLVAAVGAGQ